MHTYSGNSLPNSRQQNAIFHLPGLVGLIEPLFELLPSLAVTDVIAQTKLSKAV